MTDPEAGAGEAPEKPLFRIAPALAERLPILPLGIFPTPVQRVDLSDDAGALEILVKRDDVCAGGYAGNKVRKLEVLLADAERRATRRLITAGAAGSHHAFATAYHGRRLGFAVSLVLFPQPLTPHVRRMLLLDHAVGAELRWARRMETVPYGLWRARRAHRSEALCVVPPGGSNELGTIGYINAALELAEQLAAGEAERPARIYVAAGTLGTAAGLGIGLAWAGLDIPVIATRITARMLVNERMLGSLVNATLARLRAAGADPPPARAALRLIQLRHDQIGAGYGRATAAGEQAQRTFARAGLELDATYTAKAVASLLADARASAPRAGERLPLFWHTFSAVEPAELLDGVSADDLPPPFARYLAAAR